MTKTIDTNAAARTALGNAIDKAQNAGDNIAASTAPVACALVHMMRTSNDGKATIAYGEGDKGQSVTFTPANLEACARGGLPTKKAEASDTLPTKNMMLEALASLSPKVQAAKKRKADATAAAKKSKKASAKTVLTDKGDIAETALNSAKAPLRRALPLVAFLVNASDDYDLASVHVSGVSLMATETPDADAPDAECETVAITASMWKDEYTDNTRTSQTGSNDSDTDTKADPTSATITAESVRAGGTARSDLAASLALIAEHVSAMATTPTMSERKALQALYVAVSNKLDDDALLEANEAAAS